MHMSTHNGLVKVNIFPSQRISCTFSKIRSDTDLRSCIRSQEQQRILPFRSALKLITITRGKFPNFQHCSSSPDHLLHLSQLCIFVNQLPYVQAFCVYLLIMYFYSYSKKSTYICIILQCAYKHTGKPNSLAWNICLLCF